MNRQDLIVRLNRSADKGVCDWEAVGIAIAFLERDAIPGGFERGDKAETDSLRIGEVIGHHMEYVVLRFGYGEYGSWRPEFLTRVPPAPTVEDIKAAAIAEIDRAANEAKRKIEETKHG